MKELLPCEKEYLKNSISNFEQLKEDKEEYTCVFMEIEIPYYHFVVLKDNIEEDIGEKPIFEWSVNSGWEEIHEPLKDEIKQTVTFLYAYSQNGIMTKLCKGEETSALFDKVALYSELKEESEPINFIVKCVNNKGILHTMTQTITL